MGENLLKEIEKDDQIELVYRAGREDFPSFKQLANCGAEALIDFSRPEAIVQASQVCRESQMAVLICSTGFQPEQLKELRQNFSHSRWAIASNTSLGIAALLEGLRVVTPILNDPSFEIDVFDWHHQHKKDAPSGTALSIEGELLHVGGGKDGEVKIESRREGEEIGYHKVTWKSPYETVELSHRAHDRALFSAGALKLLRRLVKMPARAEAYNPREILLTK